MVIVLIILLHVLEWIDPFGLKQMSLLEGFGFFGIDFVMVDILGIHSQLVHMRVLDKQKSSSFLCSVVYASPHPSTRQELRDVLNLVAEYIEKPWLIVVEFNSISKESERIDRASNSWFG